MKKYFSRRLLPSFIIISVFSISLFINITSVIAQTDSLAPTSTLSAVNKSDSRFGIENSLGELFEEMYDLDTNFMEVQGMKFTKWKNIEPNPPTINGKSVYVPFNKFEGKEILEKIKKSDIESSVAIEFMNMDWAMDRDLENLMTSPGSGETVAGIVRIKPEYEGAYKNFIKHYISQMSPNLKYIQVDNEPDNIWTNGEGYYRALELTKQAVTEYEQKTGRKITVMAAGFNLGPNYMDILPEDVKQHIYLDYPEINNKWVIKRVNEEMRKTDPSFSAEELFSELDSRQLQHRYRKIHITMTVLNQKNPAFDILTIHADHQETYDISKKLIKWYKDEMIKNGYEKPLWIDDMSSSYFPLKGSELARGLENEDPAVVKEHNKRQSSWMLRKSVGHFSNGAAKIKIAYALGLLNYHDAEWRYTGLYDEVRRKLTPKPSYYSVKIIIDKLDYFKTVTKINLNKEDYLYKFTFENKPDVYVAWTEPKTQTGSEVWNFETIKTIDLSKEIQGENVEITYLVNTVDKKNQPITKPNKVVLVKQVPLSSEPIFISPTLSTPTVITSCVFDHIKYANYYPDLKTAYGSNKTKLTDHWLKYGIKEGRTPCGSDMPSCKANANNYLTIYPDVAASGMDPLVHYKIWGVNEGRVVCKTTTSANTETPVKYATVLYSWETILKLINALK